MDEFRRNASRTRQRVETAAAVARSEIRAASQGTQIEVAGRINLVQSVSVGSPATVRVASAQQNAQVRQQHGRPHGDRPRSGDQDEQVDRTVDGVNEARSATEPR